MTVPVKIISAKHYWAGGENATWNQGAGFPDNVLSELQNPYIYSRLANEKPKISRISGKTVYLFYVDSHENNKRPITEITAIVGEHEFVDPLKGHDLVSRALEGGGYSAVMLIEAVATDLRLMPDPTTRQDRQPPPQSKGKATFSRTGTALVIALLLGLGSIIMILWPNERQPPSKQYASKSSETTRFESQTRNSQEKAAEPTPPLASPREAPAIMGKGRVVAKCKNWERTCERLIFSQKSSNPKIGPDTCIGRYLKKGCESEAPFSNYLEWSKAEQGCPSNWNIDANYIAERASLPEQERIGFENVFKDGCK